MGREYMWRCSRTHWATGTFQMAHLLGGNWRKGRSKTGKENGKGRGSHTRVSQLKYPPNIELPGGGQGGMGVMYSTTDCTSSRVGAILDILGVDVVSNGGAYEISQQMIVDSMFKLYSYQSIH